MSSPNTPDIDALELGGPGEPIEFSSSEETRAAVLAMTRLAQRSLDIVTRDLDAVIFNDSAVVEAIKDFALSGRHARVRILVGDITRVVQNRHRIPNLAKRLTSFMEIRTLAPA